MKTDDRDPRLDPLLVALDERLAELGGSGISASVQASWRQVQEHVRGSERRRRPTWRQVLAVSVALAAPAAVFAAFAVASLGVLRVGPNPVELPSGVPASAVPSPQSRAQTVSLSHLAMWGESGWATEDQTGAVLHSSDGGLTWSATAVIKSDLATFLDAKHAWAATYDVGYLYTIYVTSDGGKTWRHGPHIDLCCAPAQLLFSDSSHGWALSLPNGIDAPTSVAMVWRTVDGGITWMDITAGAKQVLPIGCNNYSMAFADAATGWLVTGNCPSFFLAVTHDGGLTWNKQASPYGLPSGVVQPWAPAFNSGQTPTILVSAVDSNGSPSSPAGVLVTTDRGLTWTYRPLPELPLNNGLPRLEPVADLGRANDWWFVGRSNPAAPVLYHSRDSGRTWVRATNLPGKSVTWLDAIDADRIRLVTGGGGLLYSSDGGKTFVEIVARSVN